MKLKNSYILLIVMSLFLLISIGSVCASDSAMDADILASDDTGDVSPTPIPTSVDASNTRINQNDPQEIPVTVKDNESQEINIITENLTVTEKNKTVKFSYNNSIINITDKLSAGNHSLIITYLGDSNYDKSSKNIILSIVGNYTMKTPDSLNVNSTKIIELPANITNGVDIRNVKPNDFDATLSYKEGNDTKTINLNVLDYKNGKLVLNYPLADTIASSTMALVYTGEGNKFNKNITLNRIYNAKIDIINKENEYQNGNFTFKFTDADDGKVFNNTKVSLYTGSNIRAGFSATTNSEGIANFRNVNLYEFDQKDSTLTMNKLEVGNYAVELSLESPIVGKFDVTLTIKKANVNIEISPFSETYGTNKNVTITATNANNGEVLAGTILHLSMPQTTGKEYNFMTDSNGQSKISVSKLIPGTYNVTVSNNDTENINNISVDGNITIEPAPVKLTVTIASTYYYNSGIVATVKVTDASGKRVPNAIIVVQVYTGKTSQAYLFQADENGKAYINYAPAAVGKHTMTFNTADSRYTANAVTKTVTVIKAKAKFTAPKVAAFYKDGKYLTIKLTNTKNNKAIYGAKVNIKVFISSNSYYNYNGQTGLDGQLRISLDTYNPGTYKVVISQGESTNYTASQITTKFTIVKAQAKFVPYKLTTKKGSNVNFVVKVKNKKTNNAIAGVKVKIKLYIGKTVKTYVVKTNSVGKAKLNVKSLNVGTYKVIITSKNGNVVAQAAASKIKIK